MPESLPITYLRPSYVILNKGPIFGRKACHVLLLFNAQSSQSKFAKTIQNIVWSQGVVKMGPDLIYP